MEDARSLYRDHFNYFVNFFMATLSIGLAIYAIDIAGGSNAMKQPLPPIVWCFLGLALFCAILAFINYLKMIRTPKDTRLDDLITTANKLAHSEESSENKENSKPKINIDIRVDTADISKMSIEQLKAFGDYIDKLKSKTTKEK